MSSSELNVSLSIEALSEMSSIIKRLSSEVITLKTKNEALEKRIQELTQDKTLNESICGSATCNILFGNPWCPMCLGAKINKAVLGSDGRVYTAIHTQPLSFANATSVVELSPPLAPLECQFCFKTHPKGECEYEKWMDVLVDSVPVKPSAALKYVRIIHDKWVVVLVPDYYPVIVGECGSGEYTELDFEDSNNIATRKSLAHFKTLDRNIYSIIDNKSKVISEWICQQGFDDSF